MDIEIFKELETRLQNEGIFDDKEDEFIIFDIVKSLDSKLENRMKLQLATHAFINLFSNLRIPINIESNLVPINSIAFLFSPSGSGKDSTINKINFIFKDAKNKIEEYRAKINYALAEVKMKKDKNKNSSISDYLYKLPPLDIGISTVEGLTLSLETNQKIPVGSIQVNTNEFIAEMNTNQTTMLGLLSAISEMYDLGSKKSKQLKDKTKEVGNLKNVFINALITSSYNIYDRQDIRNTIISEFQSKLARRSSITFSNTEIVEPNYKNLDDMLDSIMSHKQSIAKDINDISEDITDIIDYYLENINNYLFIQPSAETFRLYTMYQLYCRYQSDQLNRIEHKLAGLNIANRYWQAIKLSGAISLYKKETEISKESLILAIRIIEKINNDIFDFEKELNKEIFEIFIDYCEEGLKQNKEFVIPLYKLKKLNFINSKGDDKKQILSLMNLCSSKENLTGIFRYSSENSIVYEKLEDTETINVTYKKLDNIPKEERGHFLGKEGWKLTKCTFDKLDKLLSKDFAYSLFEYENNIKNVDHIIPCTNALVFDIDHNTTYPIEKVHEFLDDVVDHHICTTSDKENKYKFRIILSLKQEFRIDRKLWKNLLQEIAKDYLLGLEIDSLSISHTYYSYKDSIVYSSIKGNKLDIKNYLVKLYAKEVYYKPLTDTEKKTQLSDIFNTFNYAFNAKTGARNSNLIRVVNHCFDLNASKDKCIEIINSINNYFEEPLPDEELIRNIYPHINKKYGEL